MAEFNPDRGVEVAVSPERMAAAFDATCDALQEAGVIVPTVAVYDASGVTVSGPRALEMEYRRGDTDDYECFSLHAVGVGGLVWALQRFRPDGTYELEELLPGPDSGDSGWFHRRVHFARSIEGEVTVLESSVVAGSYLTPARYLRETLPPRQ